MKKPLVIYGTDIDKPPSEIVAGIRNEIAKLILRTWRGVMSKVGNERKELTRPSGYACRVILRGTTSSGHTLNIVKQRGNLIS